MPWMPSPFGTPLFCHFRLLVDPIILDGHLPGEDSVLHVRLFLCSPTLPCLDAYRKRKPVVKKIRDTLLEGKTTIKTPTLDGNISYLARANPVPIWMALQIKSSFVT